MEIGITGGVEDGVDNSGAAKDHNGEQNSLHVCQTVMRTVQSMQGCDL